MVYLSGTPLRQPENSAKSGTNTLVILCLIICTEQTDKILQSWSFSRTKFEQHGSIHVYGVGSLIGGMMETFGQTFLQRGAKKVACVL